jgi:hypothetical protein
MRVVITIGLVILIGGIGGVRRVVGFVVIRRVVVVILSVSMTDIDVVLEILGSNLALS